MRPSGYGKLDTLARYPGWIPAVAWVSVPGLVVGLSWAPSRRYQRRVGAMVDNAIKLASKGELRAYAPA